MSGIFELMHTYLILKVCHLQVSQRRGRLRIGDTQVQCRSYSFHGGSSDSEAIDDDCRASFLDALAAVLDTTLTTTHFNKRCVSVENCSTRPIIYFEDGSTHETDLVLGADGIKSVAPVLVSPALRDSKFVHGVLTMFGWLSTLLQECRTHGRGWAKAGRGIVIVQ